MAHLDRRDFLRLAGVSAFLIATYETLSFEFEGKGLVRPPGSIIEDSFLASCTRCGACAKSCPTSTLLLATWNDGFRQIGTPKIDALRGPCERIQGRCEQDALCQKTCPTGAIQRVDRTGIKTGSTVINRDMCIAWRGGSCLVCHEVCPVRGAISLEDEKYPVFNAELCAGCGRCVYACPAQPKALTLTSIGEKRPPPR
jgi:ferredoxin-type protein NapG